jgi:hypothetical protein
VRRQHGQGNTASCQQSPTKPHHVSPCFIALLFSRVCAPGNRLLPACLWNGSQQRAGTPKAEGRGELHVITPEGPARI